MKHKEKKNASQIKKRCNAWDYTKPGTYMITIALANRNHPILGKITKCDFLENSPVSHQDLPPNELLHKCKYARIKLSVLGRFVYDQWNALHRNYENIVTKGCKVMPDHLHGIIFVHKPLKFPLGEIIREFKYKTTKFYQDVAHTNALLWEDGFVDSILANAIALQRAIAYIKDNPRRLAIKKSFPDIFKVADNVCIDGLFPDDPTATANFNAIGNRFLLDMPDFFQVQCSRNDFEYQRINGEIVREIKPLIQTQDFLKQRAAMLKACENNAVVVSPCISDGEKALAREAIELGFKLIVLYRAGFNKYYKPSGMLFDLCASGKLLMLAPAAWKPQIGKHSITREKALILNRLTQLIAKTQGKDIKYKRSQIEFNDTMVKLACRKARGGKEEARGGKG